MATAPPLPELDFEAMPAEKLIRWAYVEYGERLVLTCSSQKQSSVLVHMVSELGLPIDVVELDTQLFFKESYETREALVERYGLTLIRPEVITEAREGGSSGIFTKAGEMRTDLIEDIGSAVDLDDVIFEAPTKSSQAWFVKHFGPDVNLGNIPPEEVIPLETLRLGLRGDTLREVLLGGDRAGAPAS